jgi:tRNA(Ile)-lysidine synthase
VTAAAGRDDLLAPLRPRFAAATADVAAPVVVGCSGGADSVALLVLAVDAGLSPVAVHVDHGLRPESRDEQGLVAALVSRVGAAFDGRAVCIERGANVEARARDARYAALESARTEHHASAVLVAHTADDQAETVLLNVLRGSAATGLAGMRARRDQVVRPLLSTRRAELAALCDALGLPVLHDPMNDDETFRRVALRRKVLPLLEQLAARDLVPVLAGQAEILGEESDYLDALARAAWPVAGDPSARALSTLAPVVARRAVRQWLGPPPPSRAEVARVLEVASGARRATELAGGRTVRRGAGGRLLQERASR